MHSRSAKFTLCGLRFFFRKKNSVTLIIKAASLMRIKSIKGVERIMKNRLEKQAGNVFLEKK